MLIFVYINNRGDIMHIFDESREMYLKTIFVLNEENGSCRSVDVANKLGYSKPSVSRAVKNLVSDKSIEVLDNGNIILTEEGQKEAESVHEKHEILTAVFIKYLDLDPVLAEADACRVEHAISEETFQAIKKLI